MPWTLFTTKPSFITDVVDDMKQSASIKILIWLLATAFMGVFFLLPSCTQQGEEKGERNIRSIHNVTNKSIKAVANRGRIQTRFFNDSLSIYFNDSSAKRIKIIRIYDQNGGLKYLEKDPKGFRTQGIKIDCSYFQDGEYLILAYLNEEELIEKSIYLE